MTKRVILAGGGHAHLAVLADWAKQPLPDTSRKLVTSSRHTVYSGMVPGWLAGIYRANDLMIDLKPLAETAGAELIVAAVTGLDPERQTLRLSSGETMAFDLLSLATGGEADIATLTALGDRLIPVRPMGPLMERWSDFLDTKIRTPVANVAVVGGGAAGVELALGVHAALTRSFGHAKVSLVTPQEGLLAGHVAAVRRLVLAELAQRGIVVHYALAAGEENGLLLSNGTFIPADCAIAATGSRAPRWLSQSGLACNEQGFVAVGADMRSKSHPTIFAAGDIANRVDRNLERSGVHAVKAGPVLAANLRAVVAGETLSTYQPRARTLYLLALGDRRAIVSWGRFAASGKWPWWIKDWIDRHFVGKYRTAVQAK